MLDMGLQNIGKKNPENAEVMISNLQYTPLTPDEVLPELFCIKKKLHQKN